MKLLKTVILLSIFLEGCGVDEPVQSSLQPINEKIIFKVAEGYKADSTPPSIMLSMYTEKRHWCLFPGLIEETRVNQAEISVQFLGEKEAEACIGCPGPLYAQEFMDLANGMHSL